MGGLLLLNSVALVFCIIYFVLIGVLEFGYLIDLGCCFDCCYRLSMCICLVVFLVYYGLDLLTLVVYYFGFVVWV